MDLNQIAESVIAGKVGDVEKLINKAISENVEAREILNRGLMAGMNVVGEKFKANEFYLPEVLVAARAMKAGMAIIKPILSKCGVEPTGKVVIGTVEGDLHDIGKNIVKFLLEGAGFQVFDLGTNVSSEKFITAVKENNPNILGLSALLTTTMPAMADVIQCLRTNKLREKVKVVVGGAPLTEQHAQDIGANGYAVDAGIAVSICKELIQT